ncbi:hypothetical protein VNO78_22333 [Psophocarpus tetragonolobus]|uniref:RRM domain-containing protein n=1 Tax=Psophocarpus tetragonolobus TaxID=3891 RepID=A0AAN9SCI6_PSOTE
MDSMRRRWKSGKSRHFGFIEFESPEHVLQVYVIPPEHVHPRLWRGFNYRYKPVIQSKLNRSVMTRYLVQWTNSQYNVLFHDAVIPGKNIGRAHEIGGEDSET